MAPLHAGLLALAALAAGGVHPAAAARVEDGCMLLQADPSKVQVRVELSQEELEGWPDFAGDIWDTVKDSMRDLTADLNVSQILETGDIGDLVYNKTMETAAIVFAQSLGRALEVVDNATKKLRRRSLLEKNKLLALLNETGRALPGLAEAANSTLRDALANWERVRAVVDVAGSMITRAMRGAGQEGLAGQFQRLMEAGTITLDSYVDSVTNASRSLLGLAGPPMLGPMMLSQHLQSADGYLQVAHARMPQFASFFQQAFQAAVDEAVDRLPQATGRVQVAFDSVLGNVSDIVYQLRSSSRELTQSCHSVISAAADANGIYLPPWQTGGGSGFLPTPPAGVRPIVDRPAHYYSAAAGLRGLAAGPLLALLAALLGRP